MDDKYFVMESWMKEGCTEYCTLRTYDSLGKAYDCVRKAFADSIETVTQNGSSVDDGTYMYNMETAGVRNYAAVVTWHQNDRAGEVAWAIRRNDGEEIVFVR